MAVSIRTLAATTRRQIPASPYRIALAWLLHKGRHILPIPGASQVASIRDSLRATELKLSAEDIAALDRLPDQ